MDEARASALSSSGRTSCTGLKAPRLIWSQHYDAPGHNRVRRPSWRSQRGTPTDTRPVHPRTAHRLNPVGQVALTGDRKQGGPLLRSAGRAAPGQRRPSSHWHEDPCQLGRAASLAGRLVMVSTVNSLADFAGGNTRDGAGVGPTSTALDWTNEGTDSCCDFNVENGDLAPNPPCRLSKSTANSNLSQHDRASPSSSVAPGI
jgi:hypothetical protein